MQVALQREEVAVFDPQPFHHLVEIAHPEVLPHLVQCLGLTCREKSGHTRQSGPFFQVKKISNLLSLFPVRSDVDLQRASSGG